MGLKERVSSRCTREFIRLCSSFNIFSSTKRGMFKQMDALISAVYKHRVNSVIQVTRGCTDKQTIRFPPARTRPGGRGCSIYMFSLTKLGCPYVSAVPLTTGGQHTVHCAKQTTTHSEV